MSEGKSKKKFFNCSNCSVCSLWALSALLFIAIGGGFYYLIDTYFFEDDIEEEEQQTEEVDEYEGWETFSSEDYDFSFRYPSEWELEDSLESDNYPIDLKEVKLSHNNYIWLLTLDPITTGGGFDYMFEGVIENSGSLWHIVSPGGYESIMDTVFVDPPEDEDLLDAYIYEFQYDSWGGSVLFQKGKVGELIGFGPGQMGDEVEGNYFGISYYFESNTEELIKLPVKDDDEFKNTLAVLNKITNSVDLGNANYENVWKDIELPNMKYSIRIPIEWEYEEVADESNYYVRFEDRDTGDVFYLGIEEFKPEKEGECENKSTAQTLYNLKVLNRSTEMGVYNCYYGEEEVKYGALLVEIEGITKGTYENLVFSHSFNATDFSLEDIREMYSYLPVILESLDTID